MIKQTFVVTTYKSEYFYIFVLKNTRMGARAHIQLCARLKVNEKGNYGCNRSNEYTMDVPVDVFPLHDDSNNIKGPTEITKSLCARYK